MWDEEEEEVKTASLGQLNEKHHGQILLTQQT